MSAPLVLDRPSDDADDSTKRRQILDGAREVFMGRGFDAASMGDIAKTAGVSKGTLYVYFKDKDELFQAIVREECTFQPEGIFDFDEADLDVAITLTRMGVAVVQALCVPKRQSSLRAVIAIADRKPEVGRRFYETGPAIGIAKLQAYLERQVAAGRLAIADCEIAAAQFLDACKSTMVLPVLFNFSPPPPRERIERVVATAVKVFMAAYERK